ncbi:MAG: arsenic resistance N-acetyltransferase ArsN2, partial [Halobaculum sp.]
PTETRFYVARRDGDRVGCGGIERDGEVALLRSVVVTRDHRGDGLGTALCDRLVDRAARAGVESVYLLTTDAADFFASVGFTTVPRGSVPDAIRETTQFADLCPDSATVMRRATDR